MLNFSLFHGQTFYPSFKYSYSKKLDFSSFDAKPSERRSKVYCDNVVQIGGS